MDAPNHRATAQLHRALALTRRRCTSGWTQSACVRRLAHALVADLAEHARAWRHRPRGLRTGRERTVVVAACCPPNQRERRHIGEPRNVSEGSDASGRAGGSGCQQGNNPDARRVILWQRHLVPSSSSTRVHADPEDDEPKPDQIEWAARAWREPRGAVRAQRLSWPVGTRLLVATRSTAHADLLTPALWALLRYSARHGPTARIGGSWLKSVAYLERHGFLKRWECSDGCCAIRLTPTGAEALAGKI